MILAWLTYAMLVGALVSLAAVVAERGVRAQRWPARWVWAGAMALTAGLPVATWLLPASAPAGPLPSFPGGYVMASLPALTASGEPGPGMTGAELALLAWAAVSVALLGWLGAASLRIRALGRRWPRRRLDGVEVLVSRRTGPAALGLLRGRVVVPEWVLGLDARRRRLLVLHEAEHVRARDPQLAFAGLVLCALAPWHLALWWQLARLRLAVEVDCDARVLRRSRDPRGYGALLVEVGQRRARLALALADSRSMLERRIRMIASTTRRRTLRAVGLGALAGVLLALACETPGPTALSSPEPDEVTLETVAEQGGADECAPLVFLNGAVAARAALDGLDPEEVEAVQVYKGATVLAVAEDATTARSSGVDAEATGDPGCGVVVVLTKDAGAAERERVKALTARLTRPPTRPREALSYEQVAETPTFTPMHVRPTLENPGEVREALARSYPPLLRDAGIGGTANVWLLVDAEGTVRQTRINRSAGREELDAAALKTAGVMRFAPARLDDQPVPVWIALDLRFDPEATRAPAPVREGSRPARSGAPASVGSPAGGAG